VSNNRLRFDGLEQLKVSLRHLPKELRDDATTIVFESADSAVDEILDGYEAHSVSGELAEGLVVEEAVGSSAFAGAVVRNKSKLSFIFENGTQARHTALGYNRGAMPPGHVFVPAVIKWRKIMYDRLRAMMRSHGLKVSG